MFRSLGCDLLLSREWAKSIHLNTFHTEYLGQKTVKHNITDRLQISSRFVIEKETIYFVLKFLYSSTHWVTIWGFHKTFFSFFLIELVQVYLPLYLLWFKSIKPYTTLSKLTSSWGYIDLMIKLFLKNNFPYGTAIVWDTVLYRQKDI